MKKIFFRHSISIFIVLLITFCYLHTKNPEDSHVDSNFLNLSVSRISTYRNSSHLNQSIKKIREDKKNGDHSSQTLDLKLAPLLGPERREVLESIISLSDPRLLSQNRKIELMNSIGRFGGQALDTLISEVISDNIAIDDSPKRIFLIDSLVAASKSNPKARTYLESYIQSLPKNTGSPRLFHFAIVDRLEAFEKLSAYDENAYKTILPKIKYENLRRKFVTHYGFSLARRGIDEDESQVKIELLKEEFL